MKVRCHVCHREIGKAGKNWYDQEGWSGGPFPDGKGFHLHEPHPDAIKKLLWLRERIELKAIAREVAGR